MDLIKHESEHKKTNRFSNEVIKGDLTETNNNRKSPRTKPENKESVT